VIPVRTIRKEIRDPENGLAARAMVLASALFLGYVWFLAPPARAAESSIYASTLDQGDAGMALEENYGDPARWDSPNVFIGDDNDDGLDLSAWDGQLPYSVTVKLRNAKSSSCTASAMKMGFRNSAAPSLYSWSAAQDVTWTAGETKDLTFTGFTGDAAVDESLSSNVLQFAVNFSGSGCSGWLKWRAASSDVQPRWDLWYSEYDPYGQVLVTEAAPPDPRESISVEILSPSDDEILAMNHQRKFFVKTDLNTHDYPQENRNIYFEWESVIYIDEGWVELQSQHYDPVWSTIAQTANKYYIVSPTELYYAFESDILPRNGNWSYKVRARAVYVETQGGAGVPGGWSEWRDFSTSGDGTGTIGGGDDDSNVCPTGWGWFCVSMRWLLVPQEGDIAFLLEAADANLQDQFPFGMIVAVDGAAAALFDVTGTPTPNVYLDAMATAVSETDNAEDWRDWLDAAIWIAFGVTVIRRFYNLLAPQQLSLL
jgi:hypothetical protein